MQAIGIAFATLIPFATTATTGSDDWPGWRGARLDGGADGSPPVEFGETKNIRWKSALPGRGLSSPTVIGDLVVVTSAVPTEGGKVQEPEAAPEGGGRRRAPEPLREMDFVVIAFDRNDGSVVWEQLARTQMPHQGTHRDGSFAAPTIVTDGKHLFASFGSYGLYCYDLEGQLVWDVDLGDMDITNAFGEGSSPVLHGDSLIVLWDHNGASFLTSLDKMTGKEKWRTERDLGTNWTSPVVVKGKDGKAQIVVASSTTVAYDAETGEALWSCGEPLTPPTADPVEAGAGQQERRGRRRRGGIIATPIVHNGVLVYSTGTRSGGTLWAVNVEEATGHGVEETEALLWMRDRDAPRLPSPVAHDGILYALKSSSGLLSAFDIEDGSELYTSERLSGVADVWSSPVVTDGRIYIVGRDGTVEVVATGAEFETLAVNKLEETFDASPAVVGDELFLRGRENLYCIAPAD